MSDDVKPALTARQWAEAKRAARMVQARSVRGCDSVFEDASPRACHRLAALALHGQPFGFTREDVALLDRLEFSSPDDDDADAEVYVCTWLTPAEAKRLRSLMARIAALLPPEPTP